MGELHTIASNGNMNSKKAKYSYILLSVITAGLITLIFFTMTNSPISVRKNVPDVPILRTGSGVR